MTDTPKADRTRLHYATLLAPIYRWMLGDFPSAIERSRAELRDLGVGAARPGARALDLGAGLGLQTLPLVELGYEVTAVDGSEALLSELSAACPDANVVRADMAAVSGFFAGTYDVVVCMGDTLTHLRSDEEVRTVLGAASDHLAPGGLLLLTFRDYTGAPRRSTDRFLLVRGDAERVLTCFLDYGADRVLVTDVVHELSAGQWSMRASEYEKLRLAPSAVTSGLSALGLSVERCESRGGRVAIAARRAPTGDRGASIQPLR
jgi:2-polyprenyl-3-methyl-5-hydroxy-6-metoxy-1,4-benzoquinol methylase